MILRFNGLLLLALLVLPLAPARTFAQGTFSTKAAANPADPNLKLHPDFAVQSTMPADPANLSKRIFWSDSPFDTSWTRTDTPYTKYVDLVRPGAYQTSGVRPKRINGRYNHAGGGLSLPVEGIYPSGAGAFTIVFALKSGAPPLDSNTVLIDTGNPHVPHIKYLVRGGNIYVVLSDPLARGGDPSVLLPPGGAWHTYALVYDPSQARYGKVYIDDALSLSYGSGPLSANQIVLHPVNSENPFLGFDIFPAGVTNWNVAISDIAIYQGAYIPGRKTPSKKVYTLSVTTTPVTMGNTMVRKNLTGALGNTYGFPVGAVDMERIDHLAVCGAISNTPAAGYFLGAASGKYIDPAWLDAFIALQAAKSLTAGAPIPVYVSCSGNPKITGGLYDGSSAGSSFPPSSGVIDAVPWDHRVPKDINLWAELNVDCVNYLITHGMPVVGVGPWNEPGGYMTGDDGKGNGYSVPSGGGLCPISRCTIALAEQMHRHLPHIPFYILEDGPSNNGTQARMFAEVVAAGVAGYVTGIAVHDYTYGSANVLGTYSTSTEGFLIAAKAEATTAGFPATIKTAVTEWSSSGGFFYGAKTYANRFGGTDVHSVQNWSAGSGGSAAMGEKLILFSEMGVPFATYTQTSLNGQGSDFGFTGLWDDRDKTKALASRNVQRMWTAMAGNTITHISWANNAVPPGTKVLSSVSAHGVLSIFVTYRRWIHDQNQSLSLTLPQAYAGKSVSVRCMTDTKSNYLQAGGDGSLQSDAPLTVGSDGTLRVSMTPDSVELYTIAE